MAQVKRIRRKVNGILLLDKPLVIFLRGRQGRGLTGLQRHPLWMGERIPCPAGCGRGR